MFLYEMFTGCRALRWLTLYEAVAVLAFLSKLGCNAEFFLNSGGRLSHSLSTCVAHVLNMHNDGHFGFAN